MRAVRYLRVSTEEQVQGHSLDAQRTSTTQFIHQREWALSGEYLDAGHSAGSDAERPALDQLLEDAETHQFDVVVVDKVDRFYRDLKGLLTALEKLHELNITFVSVKENLDFSTPWGKLTLTVLGMLAEIYLDNLSQETSKGKRARARKGHWNGSIPIGYCRGTCSECDDPNGPGYCPYAGGPDRGNGEHLIAHPIESEAIRKAFTWYLTGQYSDGQIAERLNQATCTLSDGKMRTFRTKGLPGRWPPGSFSKDSVREILQRRFYTGVVVYYGVDEEGRKRKRDDYAACFPGQHPALITDEDFEAALDLRQQLSRRSRKPSGEPQIYLLSGLLVCSQCGERMRASSSGDRRYYRDLTRINHSGTCTQPTLKAEEIEQQVLDFMLGLHLPDDWRTWAREQVLSPQQQTEITMKQAELEARWKRVRELYLEGLLTKEEFQEERWQYQAAMTGLTPIDLNAIMEVGTTLEELPTRLGSTDSTLKQNRLLRLALVEAWVKEHSLIAVQARMHFYLLMQYCLCGSDGNHFIM